MIKISMAGIGALLLAVSLPAASAAAGGSAEQSRALTFSLDGSADSYGEAGSSELRAGLGLEAASMKLGSSALDWDLELYYSYSRSDTDGGDSNANSAGLDLAKLMLSRWRGAELEAVKPYLLAGAELTRLREKNDDGERVTSSFLAPTLGAGLEFKLNRRLSLSAEYRSNLAGGARRVSGATLGLSWKLFGGDEE
ncbi:MAG: outer membrane beta-barrel protein [Elusimicrobia bacterium]|nr:outer membrane beta-barrel protein [Elusimicrobiota bacterium]